jgi:hypothetical protein
MEICSSVLKDACLLVTEVELSRPGGLAVENSEALMPGLVVAPVSPAVIQVNYNVWNDMASPMANSQVLFRLHNEATSFHDMECWEQEIPPVGQPGERGSIEWALTVPAHEGVYTVSIFSEVKMNCAMALETGYNADALDIGTLKVLSGSTGGFAGYLPTFAPSFEPTEMATEVLFVAAPTVAPTTSPSEQSMGREQRSSTDPLSKDTGSDAEDHSSLAVAIAISSVVFMCLVSAAAVWFFSSRADASASVSEEEEGSNKYAGTPCAWGSQEEEDHAGGNDEEGGSQEEEGEEDPTYAMSEIHMHQIDLLHELHKQGVLSDGEFTQKLASIVNTIGSPQRDDGWVPSSSSPISPAHSTAPPETQRRVVHRLSESSAAPRTVEPAEQRAEELQYERPNVTYGYGSSPRPQGARFF